MEFLRVRGNLRWDTGSLEAFLPAFAQSLKKPEKCWGEKSIRKDQNGWTTERSEIEKGGGGGREGRGGARRHQNEYLLPNIEERMQTNRLLQEKKRENESRRRKSHCISQKGSYPPLSFPSAFCTTPGTPTSIFQSMSVSDPVVIHTFSALEP